MAKKKQEQNIEEIRPTQLSTFKRTERFENAKNVIQICLMAILAIALFIFLILLILAGVTVRVLPDTEGVQALTQLFIEITVNAKTVGLFALGFFFREYLSVKGIPTK
jgi:Na+-driven multidrug efflux pump